MAYYTNHQNTDRELTLGKIRKALLNVERTKLQEVKDRITEENDKRKYGQIADPKSVTRSKIVFILLCTGTIAIQTSIFLSTTPLTGFAIALPITGMAIGVGVTLGNAKIRNLKKSEQRITKQMQFIKDVEDGNEIGLRGRIRNHIFDLNNELNKGIKCTKWEEIRIKCLKKDLQILKKELRKSSPARKILAKRLRPNLVKKLQKIRNF